MRDLTMSPDLAIARDVSLTRGLSTCASVKTHLHAFADGELRGDTLRAVSHHIDGCESCADRITEIKDLGGLLRRSAAVEVETPDLAGLADGVVSRIRAEEHESWRGLIGRATDDLHWVLVGVGSVAAAFVSALVVSFVVQSGVGQRGDSLAAMLNTLATEPPTLGRPTNSLGDLAALTLDDQMLTSLAEVNDDGHVSHIRMLSSLDDRDAAILLAQTRRMRFVQHLDRRMTDPTGRQVVLLFSATEVRGKVL